MSAPFVVDHEAVIAADVSPPNAAPVGAAASVAFPALTPEVWFAPLNAKAVARA